MFSKNDDNLGLTSLTEHAIDTGNSKPVKQPFRSTLMAFINGEKQAIDKWLNQESIRPLNNPLGITTLSTKMVV